MMDVSLRGSCVIIPKPYQEAVLAQLHEGHQGIVRTKSLAHMYVWWPGIDRDVDRSVRQCVTCQKSRPEPRSPLIPLELAHKAMGTPAPGLCWSCGREDGVGND